MTVSSFDDGVDWAPDGRTFVIGAGETVQVRDRGGRLLREFAGAHSGAVMAPVVAGTDRSVLWSAGRTACSRPGRWGTPAACSRTPASARALSPARRPPTVRAWWHWTSSRPTSTRPTSWTRRRARPPSRFPCPQGASASRGPWRWQVTASVAVGAIHELGPEGLREDRGSLAVWDSSSGELLDVVEAPWALVGVGVTADGSRAVVNGLGGIAVVDLREGRVIGSPLELDPLGDVEGVTRISPDGRTAAVARDGDLVLLDVDTSARARPPARWGAGRRPPSGPPRSGGPPATWSSAAWTAACSSSTGGPSHSWRRRAMCRQGS